MEAGGSFEVADVTLDVLHTPGHTPGSVSLYCEDLDVVFTGDALLAAGPCAHEGSFPDFAGQLSAIGASGPRCRVPPGCCPAMVRRPRSRRRRRALTDG